MSEQKAFVVQRIGIVVAGSLLLAVGVGGPGRDHTGVRPQPRQRGQRGHPALRAPQCWSAWRPLQH